MPAYTATLARLLSTVHATDAAFVSGPGKLQTGLGGHWAIQQHAGSTFSERGKTWMRCEWLGACTASLLKFGDWMWSSPRSPLSPGDCPPSAARRQLSEAFAEQERVTQASRVGRLGSRSKRPSRRASRA
ncbi:hypothetical protein VTN96DRAFT_8195 [Rasamsonia emersonii]